jgi:hypothetical protein
LDPGPQSSSVKVEANAFQVASNTPSIGTLIDDRRIRDLPVLDRNILQLARIAPGVTFVQSASAPSLTQQRLFMYGARHTSVNFMLDGAYLNFSLFGSIQHVPPPDAVQEFKLAVGGGAEIGHGFATANAVTRSGENSMHGTAFGYVRGDFLSARNFFQIFPIHSRNRQIGGTLGGPVKQEKTFYFVSYQYTHSNGAVRLAQFLPSDAERDGDFSKATAPIAPILTDPLTGVNFPNSIIPAARINPVARALLDRFVPRDSAPNGSADVFGDPAAVHSQQLLLRGDHALDPNNRLSARYYLESGGSLDPFAGGLPGYSPLRTSERQQNVALELSHVVSPSAVQSVLLTFTRYRPERENTVRATLASFGAADFHVPDAAPALSTIDVSGFFTLGGGREAEFLLDTWNFRYVLNRIIGRHQFKMGTDLEWSTVRYRDNRNSAGSFQFDGNYTRNAFADFLLGVPTAFTQDSAARVALSNIQPAFYFQDAIRINTSLSLSAGLRYEMYPAWEEARGQMASYMPGAASQRFPNAPAGLVYAGDEKFPYRGDFNNLAPRVGAAWDVGGKGRLGVRASYGVYYDPLTGAAAGGLAFLPPFNTSILLTDSALGNPYGRIANPFLSGSTGFIPGQPIERSFDANVVTGYVQNYYFTLEGLVRPKLILRATYDGNLGRKLSYESELNPTIPIPGGGNRGRRLSDAFSGITQLYTGANSSYNSLHVALERRLANGFSWTASFTWSKAMDEISVPGTAYISDIRGALPQDPYNRRREHGPADFDVRKIVTATVVYQLPLLRGNRLRSRLFGGWELDGFGIFRAGTPFSILVGRDNSLSAVGSDRADTVGDPILPKRSRQDTVTEYFNLAAFAIPPIGTFGNAGRNVLTGPGFATIDAAAHKTFRLIESPRDVSLKVRFDAFNALNRVNLYNPVNVLTSPSFGRILEAYDPRVLMISAHLAF